MEAKFTLAGFERYLNRENSSLFDDLTLPEGCPIELVSGTIIERCGEFETLYADPYRMQFATRLFFDKYSKTFEKWWTGINLDYEPLHNYDRTEEWTDTFEGEIHGTASGTTGNTETRTGTETNLQTRNTQDQTTFNTTEATTYNSTDTTTYNTEEVKSTEGTIVTDDDGTSSGTVTNTAHSETEKIVDQESTDTGHTTGENTVAAFNTSTAQNPYNAFDRNAGYRDLGQTLDDTTTIEQDDDSSSRTSGTTTQDITVTHDMEDTITKTGTETDKKTGSDSVGKTGTETAAGTGTVTDQLTLNTTQTDQGTHSDTSLSQDDHETIHKGRIFGNIGVTTSSALLKEYLDISAWNFFNQVADLYSAELLILVY